MHRVIARGALVVHVLFVFFTILGGFLAWMLPWVLLPHVASAAWGARVVKLRATCPLSVIENWGRTGSGRPKLDERGFIAHYFEGRLYPSSWQRRMEVVATTLVIGSWIGLTLR